MSSVLDLVQQMQSQLDKSKLPMSQLSTDPFDLDTFLRQCFASKSSPSVIMQTLESELSAYLSESQAKVDGLIHQDLENLLRIPKGLKDFDGRIKGLVEKLTDVLGRITSSLARLEANKETAAVLLTEVEKLNSQEKKLEAQITIIENGVKIERLITEGTEGEKWAAFERLSRLVASSLSLLPTCPDLHNAVQSSASAVYSTLETALRRALTQTPMEMRAVHCLFRCFSIVKRQNTAESLFRELVAGPVVREAMDISLGAKAAKADSLLSLSLFFRKVGREMTVGRLGMVGEAGKWIGGSVAIIGLWGEIQNMLLSTKALFTPSFALEFRLNFNETISFLSHLRELLPEAERYRLSSEGVLKGFIEKWNLPAYFVLRQSEVVKVIGQKLAASGDLKRLMLDPEKPSVTFIRALDLLWSSDYYIPYIAPRFLRLHFQLLSRYVTLIQQSYNKTDGITAPLLRDLILDAKSLERYLKPTLESTLCSLKLPFLPDILSESFKLLNQITQPCLSSYIQLVLQQCGSNLQALRSIPGIYRMTNRPKPTTVSTFADSFLRPVTEAMRVIEDQTVIAGMAETVAENFREVLTEVLEAINKSELLFSKLKDSDESSQMDAEKMRTQLRLDAMGFVQNCAQWGMAETHPTLEKITKLVTPSG